MLQPEVARKWDKLKDSLDFRSDNEFANALIETQKDRLTPFVSFERVFSTPAPVIVSGAPYTRKTTSIKQLIPRIEGPVLVIDCHDEYRTLEVFESGKAIRKIDLGFKELTGAIVQSNKKQRLRYVPSRNLFASQAQITSLFMNLSQSREKMNGWTIIIDEGHRFAKLDLVRSFIAEAWKYGIKAILITSDYQNFSGLGHVLKPKQEVSQ